MSRTESAGAGATRAPGREGSEPAHPPSAVGVRRSGARLGTGVMWGAVGVLCFSGTAPATRIAAPAVGPETLTFARILIAALLAIGALALLRDLALPRRAQIWPLTLMGLGLAVGFPLLLGIALERVPAAHGAVVIGVVPAATAALSVLRTTERPPAPFWLACAAGLAAVLVFAISQGGGRLVSADLWLLAAIASCAVGYVEGGRLAQRMGAVRALSWAMILLAPLALVGLSISIAIRSFGRLDAAVWTGVLWAGTMSMFLGSIAWYRGLASGGIARIGQLNLLQPLLAITWSALILHERIDIAVPLTAVAVLAAMTVCVRSRDEQDGSPCGRAERAGQRPVADVTSPEGRGPASPSPAASPR